jgi:hypothetical protein
MALGDILLDKDQTVVGVVRSNLARGLREGGYKLAADVGSAGVSPILVDVDVKTFWAWMQPGFWALTLHGDITTELRIEGRAEPVVITVETKDSVQLGTDGAWMEILENALKEYRERIIARSASLRAP